VVPDVGFADRHADLHEIRLDPREFPSGPGAREAGQLAAQVAQQALGLGTVEGGAGLFASFASFAVGRPFLREAGQRLTSQVQVSG
jgi:hypothetical protein